MEEELKQISCFRPGSVVIRKLVTSRIELGNLIQREGCRGVIRNMNLEIQRTVSASRKDFNFLCAWSL